MCVPRSGPPSIDKDLLLWYYLIMIPQERPIEPDMAVRHDEGLLYRVDELRQSTIDYESTHTLGGMVVGYTQLEQGSFPPGTKWSKDEAGFREHFTVVEPDDHEAGDITESQTVEAVLNCPVKEYGTIGNYLVSILAEFWTQRQAFSSTRPLGDSSWDWDIYFALGKSGIVEAEFHEEGYMIEDGFDFAKADELISKAIASLAPKQVPLSSAG
jgi:hypothetical protein